MTNPENERKKESEELRNSEKEYQEIFNNLEVGYYKAKFDGTILEHNAAVNIIGGYDPSESFVGLKTRSFWDYAEEKEKYMELLMTNGFVKNYIVHVTTPKGEKLSFLTNSHLVKDQSDTPLYIEGTFVVVTEEYRLEQKLKESEEKLKKLNIELEQIVGERTKELKKSEEKYRNLIELSKDAIFKVSLDNKTLYASPACFYVYGYTPEEFISDSELIERILHPIYKEQFKDFWQQYYLNKKFPEHIAEWGWIRKDGDIVYTENIFTNIMDDQGKIIGFQTVARDITERKKAEEALIIKDNAINSSINAIAIADLEGYLTYVNPSFLKIWGYKSDNEVLGKLNTKFWQAEEKAAEVVQALRDKGGWIGELVAKRKDDSFFDVQLTSSMVNDNIGKPICMIATFIDISERKKAEQKLKESEKRYREAYNQLNFYKDLFAHDMYNILQNILSSSELCTLYFDYDINLDRIKEILERIRDQVKRGSNLIFKVQKLSEIEEAHLPIESKDVCKVLKESIDFVKASFQDRDLNIKIDTFSKNISVNANDLLFDVFENILINGIRHNINSKIELFINVSKERRDGAEYIKIEFIDNGIGIKDDLKEIIFQGGAKIDKSARGMGLGLSLVKKIIDSYNGKIWVEDKVKGDSTRGSNFILLIPSAK